MNLQNLFSKSVSLSIIAGAVMLSSCKEDERLTVSDSQDIAEEAVTDAYFQDLDDMGGIVIDAPSDDSFSSGRKDESIELTDHRLTCATITIVGSGSVDHPKGTITVDFGTGCVDNRGNVRKGKLILTYDGWRFEPGSTVVLTTENYFVNDIKLEGTRTLTNIQGSTKDAPRYNVVLTNGKATFSDGTFSERVSNITLEWVRGANATEDFLLVDESSTANGKTRSGRIYSVSLLKALVYKRYCGVAVEGVKRFLLDGEKEIVIDFGNGTCDKSVSITVNGVSQNISI